MTPAVTTRRIVRSIRWTDAEWRSICFEADRRGLRPATYARRAALGLIATPPVAPRAPRARRTRYSTPRSLTLKIRLHPEELGRLQRVAQTLAMPTSTFVRDAAVGYRINSRADSEVIRHLARIGNLLNQLTRLAHTEGLPPGNEFHRLAVRLRDVLDRLL